MDTFEEALIKNVVIALFGIVINSINGIFVVTFFRSSIFYNDPRYILYIHLVINDMIMIGLTVIMYVLSYVRPLFNVSICCILLMIGSATHKNTPLNLAGMAIERYIAICKPLHHPQICTVHRTYILIGFIWGVGFIPGLADVVLLSTAVPASFFYSFTLCTPVTMYGSTYHAEKTKGVQGIYLSFVWLILVFTYCRVLIAAKKASADKVSAQKAQSTILLHGAQLVLCMLSYVSPVIDMIFIPFFPQYRTKINFSTYLLTNILPRLLSPLIYGVRDQKFFKSMKSHLSCIAIQVESSKS
ncbi:odorant receptor 131-2-like [Chanos chanos]|uniref:Odorant receptor 131-2-like n=1 Tax=Chanos chanos TaxID=29144 RepID=A0A6J2VSC3_CHACN|nr:odorant receptor 131-2-like [Chanos chanos]